MFAFRSIGRGLGLAGGPLVIAATGAAQVTEPTPGWFRFVGASTTGLSSGAVGAVWRR